MTKPKTTRATKTSPAKKKGGLQTALKRNAATKEALATASSGKVAPKTMGADTDRPDRQGKINVTGYFDPAVRRSIRLIQAEHPELSQHDILTEALNLVFAKYRVPEAATATGR